MTKTKLKVPGRQQNTGARPDFGSETFMPFTDELLQSKSKVWWWQELLHKLPGARTRRAERGEGTATLVGLPSMGAKSRAVCTKGFWAPVSS